MTIPYVYVGCDVSKAYLDFFVGETKSGFRIDNAASAIAEAASALPAGAFVVYEATGGYDRALRLGLVEAGIASRRINPTAARRFAEATRRKAKTDALDAAMLADFGEKLKPPADDPPSAERERLALFARRRDQLVATRAEERTRLKGVDETQIAASIARMIETLSAEIAVLDDIIAEKIRDDAALSADAALLATAPGVGPVTATTLLALMPELGALSPKEAASLAGLAPFNHDSGALRGKRCISGGRRRVRHALYMAAFNAVRTCKRYAEFYAALCARKAARKIALIAVARKLLLALNAMIRDRTAFA